MAIAPAGRQDRVRLYGTISHDLHALERALGRLTTSHCLPQRSSAIWPNKGIFSLESRPTL
jgi:hypothetical protein